MTRGGSGGKERQRDGERELEEGEEGNRTRGGGRERHVASLSVSHQPAPK